MGGYVDRWVDRQIGVCQTGGYSTITRSTNRHPWSETYSPRVLHPAVLNPASVSQTLRQRRQGTLALAEEQISDAALHFGDVTALDASRPPSPFMVRDLCIVLEAKRDAVDSLADDFDVIGFRHLCRGREETAAVRDGVEHPQSARVDPQAELL